MFATAGALLPRPLPSRDRGAAKTSDPCPQQDRPGGALCCQRLEAAPGSALPPTPGSLLLIVQETGWRPGKVWLQLTLTII